MTEQTDWHNNTSLHPTLNYLTPAGQWPSITTGADPRLCRQWVSSGSRTGTKRSVRSASVPASATTALDNHVRRAGQALGPDSHTASPWISEPN